MTLQGHDLAILTARFGAARFGASRFGFIPCPEDVKGSGAVEPGEYVWKEETVPSQEVETDWTLVAEDCVCRKLCKLALGTVVPSDDPVIENDSVTFTVPLTGVVGLVSGVTRVHWGDGQHDKEIVPLLTDGNLTFTHTYLAAGSYTVEFVVHDERGCTATKTLPVTVITLTPLSASFVIDIDGQGAIGGASPQTTGMTLTPTVGGGSGHYSYAWRVWNEYTEPLYTSTAAIPYFDPDQPSCCLGQATLVVTDTVTLLTVNAGPESWNWNCI
jgi:hypothetical protein